MGGGDSDLLGSDANFSVSGGIIETRTFHIDIYITTTYDYTATDTDAREESNDQPIQTISGDRVDDIPTSAVFAPSRQDNDPYTAEKLARENLRLFGVGLFTGLLREFIISPYEDFAQGKILKGACNLAKVCKQGSKLLGKAIEKAKKIKERFSRGRKDVTSKTDTLQPGPFADESIPARSQERNFTKAERAAINKIGRKSGCHTCGTTDPGTKSGDFIPDHQTPNKLNSSGEPQRLFPHCKKCSNRQGGQVTQELRRRGKSGG